VEEYTVFVNGEFVPEREARISILDHAVLYGDGVFETAVAWKGRIFRLHEHLDRLFRSLAALRLPSPYAREELLRLIVETVRLNGLPDAYVKWVITRGSNGTPLLDPTGCEPGCIILVRPYLYMIDEAKVTSGIRVKTVAVRRPSADVLDARIKSLNYINLIVAKIEALAAKVDEALLLNLDGHVCEAPGYNVFVVSDGRLRTPVSDVLEGITRQAVFDVAASRGLPSSVASLELYDLYVADEVFLCSTAGGIVPVVEIDGRAIGAGIPGRLTQIVRDGYMELLATDPTSIPVPDLAR
jgi:branched-chain amino acid aminotransferase